VMKPPPLTADDHQLILNRQLFAAIRNPCQGVHKIQELLRKGAILTKDDAERNLITLIHNTTTNVSITISILQFVLKKTKLCPTKLIEAARDMPGSKIMDFLVDAIRDPIPDEYLAKRDQVIGIAAKQLYEHRDDWEHDDSTL